MELQAWVETDILNLKERAGSEVFEFEIHIFSHLGHPGLM